MSLRNLTSDLIVFEHTTPVQLFLLTSPNFRQCGKKMSHFHLHETKADRFAAIVIGIFWISFGKKHDYELSTENILNTNSENRT